MTDEKPTKEYYFALVGESLEIIREMVKVKAGMKRLTQVETDELIKRKDWVHEEIGRVRKLL